MNEYFTRYFQVNFCSVLSVRTPTGGVTAIPMKFSISDHSQIGTVSDAYQAGD